jgi:hypothetical protein
MCACYVSFAAPELEFYSNPGARNIPSAGCVAPTKDEQVILETYKTAFFKLWSADHKWSSGSALVVLLDWTLVKKQKK